MYYLTYLPQFFRCSVPLKDTYSQQYPKGYCLMSMPIGFQLQVLILKMKNAEHMNLKRNTLLIQRILLDSAT
jgi:hypothetical protein